MLEYILMTQLYFTDGTYAFRNYNMVAPNDGKECSELTKSQAVDLSVYLSGRDRSEIKQIEVLCTDKHVTLDFYPVPKTPPVPTPRPRSKGITV